MQTIAIDDIIKDSLPQFGWGDFCIYIFRDGDFVLYVGKSSRNIIERIMEHLGFLARGGGGEIGTLVDDNVPESYQWSIDLMTLDDCKPFAQKHFPKSRGIDLEMAEQAMILELSPALNRLANPHPSALPHKYTFKRDNRMKAAHRIAFPGKKSR